MYRRRTIILSAALCALFSAQTAIAVVVAELASRPMMHFDGAPGAAVGDTIDLMGPLGLYPYRGDFETGPARPGGSGELPDGWYSLDGDGTPETTGVGDFARVWSQLGDADGCASNPTKMVAFLDDGLVVPGTGGSIGVPGFDYGPPGGFVVNSTGGVAGPGHRLDNCVCSPVMTWPDPALSGLSLAFDVYSHELLIPAETPGIVYTWSIRSTNGGDIETAEWRSRGFGYYGGPEFSRSLEILDDLLVPGVTRFQVALGVRELGSAFGYGDGASASPAPYFDNVRVKVYATAGPRIAVNEIYLANDGFPASGVIDLADPAANSIRFDMAANIAGGASGRNDPGDSLCVDVTPRAGGSLDLPVMYWTFARRNPLFDPFRSLPPNPIVGCVTRGASGDIVPHRYHFDLPDTGMIFPGDELHYYFAATDHLAGEARTSFVPADRSGFGDARPGEYPGAFAMSGLPSLANAAGDRPSVLLWNDAGFGATADAWTSALRLLCLENGMDIDVFDTHGAGSGVGNGLGGRATVDQLAGYRVILYTCGDLEARTISNGAAGGDPGNDLGLLEGWLAAGGRDLLLAGDNLASTLQGAGAAANAFLADRMGVTVVDAEVRDNIANQAAPRVLPIADNPVFAVDGGWVANGGCPRLNGFDAIVPTAAAMRLAQFAGPGGTSTPYPFAAAILKIDGTNRVVTLNHDLAFARESQGTGAAGARVLHGILQYFGVPMCVGAVPDAGGQSLVSAHPNPFNPSVTIAWALPRVGHLTVGVYDLRGALVRRLHDAPVDATSGRLVWDGADAEGHGLPSGLYFVEARSEGRVDVIKVTLVR